MTDTADLLARWNEIQLTKGEHLRINRAQLVMPSDFASPGALAKKLDPSTVQTPALELIDSTLVGVQRHMNGQPGGVKDAIVSMPPQEGKSERITHYGALWFLQQNPNLRIGLVGYGEDIVRRHSYAIRNDIVTNNGTEGNIDLGLRLRRDTKAAGRWNLDYPHRGGIYAVSIGGPLTGRPLDLLIIDDPVKDRRAAESVFMSAAAWTWWQTVARPRLAPNAPVIVVLTRWHELDLAGRLEAKQVEDEQSTQQHYDRWHVVNIPAKADHDPGKGQSDILDREPGEYLLSARGRTQAQWEAIENGTERPYWESMYQGRPNPEKGDVWEEGWWLRYKERIWQHDVTAAQYRVVVQFDQVIQSWDMSFKDKKSSDFVVCQVWCKVGSNSYLLDTIVERMTFTETVREMRHMAHKWPQSSTKLVEDKANGTAVIDFLKDEIAGLTPINPTDSKYGRAVAVSPFIRAGNIWLPDKSIALPGVDVAAFISECNAFPNGAHDDQVDTTSQALDHLYLGPKGITSVGLPQGRVPSTTGSGRGGIPPHMRRAMQRRG